MRQLYTLDEIHRYADEIRLTEQEFRDATKAGQIEAMKVIKDQILVMREMVLHMHESLEKYGPRQTPWIRRVFEHKGKNPYAKGINTYYSSSSVQALSSLVSKNVEADIHGHIHPTIGKKSEHRPVTRRARQNP